MNIRRTAIAILAVGAHVAPGVQVTGSAIVEILVEGGGSARVSLAARVAPEAEGTTGTGQVQIRWTVAIRAPHRCRACP